MSNTKTILLPREEGSTEPEIVSDKLRRYIDVDVHTDETTTDEADLNIVNNFLEVTANSIGKIQSIGGLAVQANTASKFIETRRKIKKLPFGLAPAKDANVAKRKLVVIE